MSDSKTAKKQYINRINYIRGHLKGVEKMINDDRYCIDVILQMGAVIKALKKITKLILENHLNTCMTRVIRGKSEKERKRKIKELLVVREPFYHQAHHWLNTTGKTNQEVCDEIERVLSVK